MIIGLYGPSRAGKDSVAGYLVNDFGYEQRAMAAAIRAILLGLDPLLMDEEGNIWGLTDLFARCDGDWDQIKAESKESVDLMIRLGQTCRDVLGETVWLDVVMPPVNSAQKIVISDVRQPNEYRAIKERGGEVWKISKPDTEKRGMDGLLEGYEFDARIDNRGSLVDLRGIVQATIATNMNNKEKRGKGYGI